MITGTTSSGFAFEIKEEALDDYELLEALSAMDNTDIAALPKVIGHLLGDEQTSALKLHIKQKKGYVSSKAMVEAITDILGSTNAGKNS